MKKTNLDAIRQVAVAFLYTEIHETGIVFVASHPFTDRWETYMLDSEWGDLHDSKTARKWREIIEKQLKKSDLFGIFVMMNRPYILNFLKFVEGYMSDEDLGTILGSFWSNIEQISLDDSVTGKIWTLEVPKERILCAFDGKEKEIILNLYGFKKKISVEKV